MEYVGQWIGKACKEKIRTYVGVIMGFVAQIVGHQKMDFFRVVG